MKKCKTEKSLKMAVKVRKQHTEVMGSVQKLSAVYFGRQQSLSLKSWVLMKDFSVTVT